MRRSFSILVLILILVGMPACSSRLPAGSLPTPSSLPPTQAVQPSTPTLAPTDTPQPPRLVLLAPPQADSGLAASLQPVLQAFAVQEGLQFEPVESLSPGDLDAVPLVVALPPDPGLDSLAAAAPDTRFLAVGISGLQPRENLLVVGAGGGQPDQAGFLAGYIAAAITTDWRVGVISLSDDAAGQAAKRGFVSGVIYLCGLCRTAYPPFIEYPQVAEVPANAGQAERQAAADALIASAVETIYVYPGAGDDALYDYLAQSGIHIIGGQAPTGPARNQWVASVRADLLEAVKSALPQALGGAVPETPGSLIIADRNEALFSPGRQLLVDRILADLSQGFIDTGQGAAATQAP